MSLVLGLGIGTFVLVVISVASILTCFLFSTSVYSRIIFIVGLAIPVILLILFTISPKGQDNNGDQARNWNFLSRILLGIALCVGFVVGVACLLNEHCLVQRKWRPPRTMR